MTAGAHRQALIGALGIVQILAWGSSYYLPAVLAGPIAADTGWPLPWIVGSLSAGLLVAGLISPQVGRLIGQHGGRPVLAASALLLALGLLLLGLAPALPVFVAGWLVLGAGMGAGLYDAAFATLGRQFGAAARPAITTLTLWGGFASTVCWPFSAWLVENVGWRGACFAYAATHVAVTLPLVLLLIPRPPARPVAHQAGGAIVTITSVERRRFLLFAAVQTIGGVITSTMAIHLLTLLQAQGLALAAAVSLGILMGPSQVGARLIEMAAGGRHHPLWTLTGAVVLTALGLVLLWSGFPLLAATIVLYGAGNGIASIAKGTVPLALFGPDRYAPLVGRIARPALIAQALAPSAAAFVLDQFGAESLVGTIAGLGIINVGLVLVLWLECARPSQRSIRLPATDGPKVRLGS